MPLFSYNQNFNWVPAPNAQVVLSEAISDHATSGGVGAGWSAFNPKIIYHAQSGKISYLPDATSVTRNTIYDWASLTKGVATATTIARLVDRGWIDWETPLSALLPSFPDHRVLISHLLTHTSGLPAWLPLYEEMSEQFKGSVEGLRFVPLEQKKKWLLNRLTEVPLQALPGEKRVYSDLGFLLLGYAIESVTATCLKTAVQSYVLDPLEMDKTNYRPIMAKPEIDLKIAVTSDEGGRGSEMIPGEVHDENCWALGGVAGHAGLFGPIDDLMKFARALLNGFLASNETTRTLGWDTPSASESSCGHKFSNSSFGHLGFTGTSLWMDVEGKRAVGLLTNRVHPNRENIKIRLLRPQFHDAIIKDIKNSI